MSKTNQDLLTQVQNAMKALTTSDMQSSLLEPSKRQQFVRTVSQSTNILNAARRIDMTSHTHDIDRIGFASRILGPSTEGKETTNEAEPNNATNTLKSVEATGFAGITDSTLEDNIEQEGFEDTLLAIIAQRVGIDLEELFLNGDTSSSDGFLALTDGWLKKAGNEVTSSDFSGSGGTTVENMFDAMINAVPKKYLRDRSSWKLYAHWDIEDAYRDVLRNRGTGLGDSAQTTGQKLAYKGITVEDSASMPAGQALLVPTSNLVYGIYRDIRIEPDRNAKARKTDFVTSVRVDAHYEDENAAVVAKGYSE